MSEVSQSYDDYYDVVIGNFSTRRQYCRWRRGGVEAHIYFDSRPRDALSHVCLHTHTHTHTTIYKSTLVNIYATENKTIDMFKSLAFIIIGSAVAGTAAAAGPPASIPVYDSTYVVTVKTVLHQAGGDQTSMGIQAWDVSAKTGKNRTAWAGNRNPFVADFGQGVVYYPTVSTGGEKPPLCQCTCPLPSTDTACSSQLEGGSFCGFDYQKDSKYIGTKTMPSGESFHYEYKGKLLGVTFTTYELFFDAKTLYPVQQHVMMTPFGKTPPIANFTMTYSSFKETEPAEKYFAMTGVEYCQQCDSSICSDDQVRVNAIISHH